MISLEQARLLEQDAEQNGGKCSNCHQTIKIYRYRINSTHARFLKAMAAEVDKTGVNDVDLSKIDIAYSTRSQCSKLRQHGLIARVKDARGVQVPRHWLITKKGWGFLKGEMIPSKVVVYNNQTIGHDGGMTSIYRVYGDTPHEAEPVSEAEARTYQDVRTPVKTNTVFAEFKGNTNFNGQFLKGNTYPLEVERLQVGKPVKIARPVKITYKDIAAFQRDWKVK